MTQTMTRTSWYKKLNFRLSALFFLSASIGFAINQYLKFDQIETAWLFLSIFLLNLTESPGNRWQQSAWYIIAAIMFAISAILASYLTPIIQFFWFYPLLFLSIFIIIMSGSICSQLSIISTVAACYFAISLNIHQHALSAFVSLHEVALPIFLASLIVAMINAISPKHPVTLPPPDNIRCLIKRNTRIALAVTLAYAIGEGAHLPYPTWAVITILVVSRGTLGATIHRAWHRILGTAIGVILSVPLVLILTKAHNPMLGPLMLLFITLSFLFTKKSYVITMFLITLCVGPLYFYLYPAIALHPFLFTLSRLVETGLGIAVILLLEIFLFPYSIVELMKGNSKNFWKKLAISLNDQAHEHSRHINTMAANSQLDKLHEKLDDCRYEPLVILTDRYHYILKLLIELRHILKLHAIKNKNLVNTDFPLIEKMSYLSKKISDQYKNNSKSYRISFLNDLKKEITNEIDQQLLPKWAHNLYQHYLQCIELYIKLSQSSQFKLSWNKIKYRRSK